MADWASGKRWDLIKVGLSTEEVTRLRLEAPKDELGSEAWR